MTQTPKEEEKELPKAEPIQPPQVIDPDSPYADLPKTIEEAEQQKKEKEKEKPVQPTPEQKPTQPQQPKKP